MSRRRLSRCNTGGPPYPTDTPSRRTNGGARGRSGDGSRKGATFSSTAGATLSSLAIIFRRDCACRALVADARKRSTKACMWARLRHARKDRGQARPHAVDEGLHVGALGLDLSSHGALQAQLLRPLALEI